MWHGLPHIGPLGIAWTWLHPAQVHVTPVLERDLIDRSLPRRSLVHVQPADSLSQMAMLCSSSCNNWSVVQMQGTEQSLKSY